MAPARRKSEATNETYREAGFKVKKRPKSTAAAAAAAVAICRVVIHTLGYR